MVSANGLFYTSWTGFCLYSVFIDSIVFAQMALVTSGVMLGSSSVQWGK